MHYYNNIAIDQQQASTDNMKDKDFAPINKSNRLEYLDLIRGISIFGILIVNLRWFSLYTPGFKGVFVFPEIDHVVRTLQYIFIEGKFYSMFSLLFGWGIALQIERSRKDDASTAAFIRRRLWFMLLLGGIHLFFIWEGDIVFLYGLAGFILVALRNYSNRTLLITGILLILSPILLYFLKMHFSWINWPSDILYEAGEKVYQMQGLIDQDTSRTPVLRETKNIFSIIGITWADAPYRFAYLFFVSRIPKVLGTMLIGFVIARTDFYQKAMLHRKKLVQILIAGLLIFVPLNVVLFLLVKNEEAYYALQPQGLYYTAFYSFTVFPLALVYMIGLALAFKKPWINKLLRPVLPVGRTAFSNYVGQSLIGIILFYGIGFGWAEQFGPLAWTILAVIIFTVQVIFSGLWLKYFRFGLLEWIWRSFTYGKIQPILVAKK
ncbi:DUF418 domain-containing protein [uncultured Draconibacterium sp.]|uniref:DUF418 domain-containing protein n=1 Tax=uncultured Draconibacterium sp. TaxID=1573823 RepID=UPI0029C92CC8|nr:DUF418 domain-containing protein [uncultured Draconibacterium sp.]